MKTKSFVFYLKKSAICYMDERIAAKQYEPSLIIDWPTRAAQIAIVFKNHVLTHIIYTHIYTMCSIFTILAENSCIFL